MNDIMREAKKQAAKEAKSKKGVVPAKYRSSQTTPFQETVPPKGKIILEVIDPRPFSEEEDADLSHRPMAAAGSP